MDRSVENVIALIATGTVLILGLAVLSLANDGAFALHGFMMLVASGFGVKFIVERMVAASSSSELVYHDEVIKMGHYGEPGLGCDRLFHR